MRLKSFQFVFLIQLINKVTTLNYVYAYKKYYLISSLELWNIPRLIIIID